MASIVFVKKLFLGGSDSFQLFSLTCNLEEFSIQEKKKKETFKHCSE